VSEQSNY